ncbi:carbohydrate ABC transporter permease [Candidatus Caldatribacterium saccharofermentans]|uniref:carbohydrate ABC transporter permease n=1 Tax=Candidatus Caldatribacterium saccharofermentans TaxID=1454753 RepID=UPI003D042FCE
MKREKGTLILRIVIHLFLIVGAGFMLLPLIWCLSSSFKTSGEIFTYPPTLLPKDPTLSNYTELFSRFPYGKWYLNSIVYTVLLTTLSVFFCSLAGFAFAKYRFALQKPLFAIVLAALIVPFQVVLIPLYVTITKLGWMNTYYALVVPFMASPFGIFLMRQFMVTSIPTEIIESARIDGCSELGIFLKIVLPLSQPALGAFAIYQFVFSWNSFLWPLIVLNETSKYTLPIGLQSLFGIFYLKEFGILMAGSALMIVPVVTVFVFMQRYFVSGLTVGAVKE